MPQAIWKGHLQFGLVSIPVGIYAAEAKVIDIMDLLKRSLEESGGKRKAPARARARSGTKARKKQQKRA